MLSHRVLSVTAEVRHRVLPLKRTEGRGFARKYAVEGRAGEAEDKAEGAARAAGLAPATAPPRCGRFSSQAAQ